VPLIRALALQKNGWDFAKSILQLADTSNGTVDLASRTVAPRCTDIARLEWPNVADTHR